MLSKLFKKKNNSQKLRDLYIKSKYTVIPSLPDEVECKRILTEYTSFPFSIVPKEYMVPLPNGLLFGHIVLLWWLNNSRTNKNTIPGYFLYMYGIDFYTEKEILVEAHLISNNVLTEKGVSTLKEYNEIIRKHKAKKTIDANGNIIYSYSDKQLVIKDNKLIPFRSTNDFLLDQDLGKSYEQNNEYVDAIKAYESAKLLSLKEWPEPPPNVFLRLSIIYRKLKDYENEIKVIKEALNYYPSSEIFQKRLEKAQQLNSKNKNLSN
ncbi:tetratricopeptide repeat protein [Listeria goaensis]|uniref:tetratricopeptide repeat protein n=1 Tax=Listeria goaensis TaxID=1649188 RepID=UPI000B58DD32|nr:tetratricopeptide repeat protein [Listeria goaensis]